MTRFDDSDWPILRVHVETPQTIEDLDAYLEGLTSYLARGERFGVLGSSSGTGGTAPGAAKRQMAWMQDNAQELGKLMVGMAGVVPGATVGREQSRGASLSARLPFPMEAFPSEDEAKAWLTERLARASRERDDD